MLETHWRSVNHCVILVEHFPTGISGHKVVRSEKRVNSLHVMLAVPVGVTLRPQGKLRGRGCSQQCNKMVAEIL